MQQKLNFGFDGDYYVYALKDPRNNQEFYIGKGKGNRLKSHLTNNSIKAQDNLPKYLKVQDIQNQGLEVITEIIADNLDEKTAFNIEELIIYKLGRQVLEEGDLLNYMRGGNQGKDESIFYDNKPNIEIDLNTLSKASRKKLSTYKKVSNIIHLNKIQHKFKIYTYDEVGLLLSIDTVKCFFNKNKNVDLFPAIIIEKLPIFKAGLVYSKYPIQNFFLPSIVDYTTKKSRILTEFLFESEFLRKLDQYIKTKKDFEMVLKSGKSIRLTASYQIPDLVLTTYYSNGSKKELQRLIIEPNLGNEPFLSESKFWSSQEILLSNREYDRNGDIIIDNRFNNSGKLTHSRSKEDDKTQFKEFFNNGNLKSRTTTYKENSDFITIDKYYECGNLNIIYGKNSQGVFYENYQQNGLLYEKLIPNVGYVRYDKKGGEISISPNKHSDFIDHGKVLKTVFPKTATDEELEKEVMKAAEEWEKYKKTST